MKLTEPEPDDIIVRTPAARAAILRSKASNTDRSREEPSATRIENQIERPVAGDPIKESASNPIEIVNLEPTATDNRLRPRTKAPEPRFQRLRQKPLRAFGPHRKRGRPRKIRAEVHSYMSELHLELTEKRAKEIRKELGDSLTENEIYEMAANQVTDDDWIHPSSDPPPDLKIINCDTPEHQVSMNDIDRSDDTTVRHNTRKLIPHQRKRIISVRQHIRKFTTRHSY